jgi:hypothetical protein
MNRVAAANVVLMSPPDATVKDVIQQCGKELDVVIASNPRTVTRDKDAYIRTFSAEYKDMLNRCRQLVR